MKTLLILASGYSSRFGGFPKAFCQINGKYNVQRTIDIAKKFFSTIYVVVNEKTFNMFKNSINDAIMIKIRPGNGDAESLMKALRIITGHLSIPDIVVTWGDAVFVDAVPFYKLSEITMNDDCVAMAVTAADKHPYAYFELEGDNIICSHFAHNHDVQSGEHDQSLFILKIPQMIHILTKFCNYMHDNPRQEKKLLHCFTYMYRSGLPPAKIFPVSCGHVLSFNTKEEYTIIKKQLEEHHA